MLPAPPRRVAVGLLAVAALAAASVGVRYALDRGDPAPAPGPSADETSPPPPDPRASFPTPFRNVRPEVSYVGDAACAGCHPDVDRTYHAHPMGRSAAWVSQARPLERYDAAANDPARVDGFTLRAEKAGDRLRHVVTTTGPDGRPLPPYEVPIDLEIGSGTRGRSYLSVQHGAVWQSPLSWFTHAARWDLAPGVDPGLRGRRPVTADCLFCHTDRVEPVKGAVNRFHEPLFPAHPSIGCERCHGPGGLHVAERRAGEPAGPVDHSIVNPKHLDPDLRAAVCQQCHLQGEVRVVRRGRNPFEFRPGLPLEQFVAAFVPRPDLADALRSVSQFEQLGQSRCFTASGGKLDCTSCHDPHEQPAAEAADQFYRGRCLTCHGSKGCSLPAAERKAKADNCAACHMPKAGSANIAHAAVTDHRIPRRPGSAANQPAAGGGSTPLIPFRPGPHAPPREERDRDLGVALGVLAAGPPAWLAPERVRAVAVAEERLRAAVRRDPKDVDAWLALAALQTARRDPAEGLKVAEAAAAAAPDSEAALAQLAHAAGAAEDYDLAVRTADRLVEMNPTSADHRVLRAGAYLRRHEWGKAEADCRAALAIFPLHPLARLYLAAARYNQGDAIGARKESDAALGLVRDAGLRSHYQHMYRMLTR